MMTKAAKEYMAQVDKKFAKKIAKWSGRAAERIAAAKESEIRALARQIAKLAKRSDYDSAEENVTLLLGAMKAERAKREAKADDKPKKEAAE